MAYNNYNNNASYGYNQPNQYQPSTNAYSNAPTYHNNTDVEMQSLQTNNPFNDPNPPRQRDPNAILNDCRQVGKAIDDLESRLQDLQRIQRQFVSGNGATNRDIDATSTEIMSTYRYLGDRVRRIKSQPDARLPRNEPQVSALDRRIRKAIQSFQTTESAFRAEVLAQQKRQYLIVNPTASEAEISAACSEADTQIFAQALLQSDRRGQAQSTLANVRQRHDAIQQIEKTMIELAQLFQDLDVLVVQQEDVVRVVEEKAEETNVHMVAANEQLDVGITSARSARRKKWWCLLVALLILVVVAIVAVIVVLVLKKTS